MPPGPPYNVLLGCGLGGFVLFTLSFSLRNFNFFHGNITYMTSFCSLFVGPASKSVVWFGTVSCYTTMSGTILSKSLSHFIVLAPFISSSGVSSRDLLPDDCQNMAPQPAQLHQGLGAKRTPRDQETLPSHPRPPASRRGFAALVHQTSRHVFCHTFRRYENEGRAWNA